MKKSFLHSCFSSHGNRRSPHLESGDHLIIPKLLKTRKIQSQMKNFLVLFFFTFTFYSSIAQPTTAAPDPFCDQTDVISLFSNSYTDVTVDTWLTTWSAATLTDIQISGNDTKLYESVNFLGIETVGPNLIDASSMTYFHMDIWTPNMTTFRIKLVDFGADGVFGGGDDSEHEIPFTSPAQNEWITYAIPLSDFTGLASTEHIAQYILSGLPTGGGTVYVDNVYFSNMNCVTPAPAPTEAAANVISLFSNSYTDVPVDTWLTTWSAATLTDIQISGNDTKLYESVNFLGIETVGPNLVDASSMTSFHMDIWTPNMTTFRIKLVDFGADGVFGGGDDSEHEIPFTSPAQNEWISYEIPLTDFTGLASTEHIAQYILSGLPVGGGTVYVDNVYFSAAVNTSADVEFCVDLSCLPSATAPSVFGSFNGWCANCNLLTDQGSGIWCTTVNIPNGNYEYKFFVQEGEEQFMPGGSCTVTNGGFTNRSLTVAGSPLNESYGWNSCDATCSAPPTPADITFCVDVSCFTDVNNVNIFGFFNGWNPSANALTDQGGGIWCTTINMPAGDQQYKFLINGVAEEFMPGGACTVTAGGFTNRVIAVNAVPQNVSFGFNSCDATCIPFPPKPDLPITFEDTGLDYSIANFGDMMTILAPDPTDPTNRVACSTKPNGAPVWAGTVVADLGLENPIPFTATEMKMTMRVWSPVAGTPFLLKVEQNGNPGISSEVLVSSTAAMTWETLVFDFANGTPAVNTALVYDKIVVFSNFGNIGANRTYYWDDISFCPAATVALTCPPTSTVEGCSSADAPAPYADLAAFIASGGTATDADPASFTFLGSVVSGSCPITMVRTYQVADLCGNTATCEETILIDDTTAPTFTVPANATIDCSDDPTDLNITGNVSNLMDNCGGTPTASFMDDDSNFSVCDGGTIERTWTVTDACGNDAVEIQTITVNPPPPPVITCPADAVVACDDEIVLDPNAAVATSECSNIIAVYIKNPIITGVPGCDGTVYTYIYVAVDDCGRSSECEQQILIQNTPASITVPAGSTVACVKEVDLSLDDATVTGGCANYNLYLIPPVASDLDGCPGSTYTYTYRLVDDCGNIVEEPVVFTNGPTDAPTIDAPASFTVNCLAGATPNPDNATVTTSCGVGSTVTVSGPQIFGPTDCSGTVYRYTYTVTDACGRTATDIQDMTVQNGPPVFNNCPEDNWLVLNCEDYGGEGGTIDVIEAWIASVTASTSCNVPLTVFNNFNPNNINTCMNNGFNTVTFRATDNCGRTTFCQGTYVVVDTEAPEIIEEAQDHWEICNYNTQDNLNAWVQNQGGALASDGCSGGNISWQASPANPQINCNGGQGTTSVTVQFIVTDNCGNKTTTTATFNALAAPGFAEPEEEANLNTGSVTLFQNNPNPFKDQTVISFSLPIASQATLTIYDMNGRVLKVVDGNYYQGLNEVSINRSDLGGSGVKYYTLRSQDEVVSKVMVLID